MDLLSHLPLAIALLLASLWLYNLWRSRTHSHKIKFKSPPEPPGAWPVIGHLHLLRGGGQAPLARTLGAMADKYGPVFLIRLGVHPVLVVSNWESFKECFTTNDITLASRPQSEAGKQICAFRSCFYFYFCRSTCNKNRTYVKLCFLSNFKILCPPSQVPRLQHGRIRLRTLRPVLARHA